MNNERELERHNKILEQITTASTKEELPSISLATINKYLADNVYFEDRHISATCFSPILDAITKYKDVTSVEVRNIFIKVVKENYPNISEEEILGKYIKIATSPRINYILEEVEEKNKKLDEFTKQEYLDTHNRIMEMIRYSYELKDVPTVTASALKKAIVSDSKNSYTDRLKKSDTNALVDLLLQGKKVEDKEVQIELLNICRRLSPNNANDMFIEIYPQIKQDDRISYLIEEIKYREQRITEIYKENHDRTMEQIKDARRISQLPPNLTISTLSGYLAGNTIIYPKTEKMSSVDLINLTNLLLEGHKWEDKEIKEELFIVAEKYYPEKKEEAYELLFNKLSILPRTFYLVEEINYSNSRQTTFIGNQSSNVNVYFVPNPKTPETGGRFYNVYINRIDNLNLEEILPLELDKIVPPGMDVDSIEYFVQENYDETFKNAGGIILNKDETIGNVNIFKPSDGKVGISKEEQSRYQELEDLSLQVKEIIARKKEETNAFMKMQQAFLQSQLEIDEKLAGLEAKIDTLTKAKGRGSK